MLSSTTTLDDNDDETTTRSTLNRASSSSSSSTSLRSSSSSPASHFRPRTMEDVWKDINLSSLGYDHSTSSAAADHHRLRNPTFIFQDFLAGPSPAQDQPTASAAVSPSIFRAPLPSSRTVLSLNPGVGLDLLESTRNSRLPSSNISNFPGVNPFEGLGSPAGLGAAFGKKRVNETERSSGDRRHNRMIKNRESAARSRARKQAYTNELEREVDFLLAENARLKKQQEQLTSAAAVKHQLRKKHTLHRTSTAPF